MRNLLAPSSRQIKIKAAGPSETSLLCHPTTRLCIPEDCNYRQALPAQEHIWNRRTFEHDFANRLTNYWTGTLPVRQVLNKALCLMSTAVVRCQLSDGPESIHHSFTNQWWHTVGVTSVSNCSLPNRPQTEWVLEMIIRLMYMVISYTIFNSGIQEVPDPNLGQTGFRGFPQPLHVDASGKVSRLRHNRVLHILSGTQLFSHPTIQTVVSENTTQKIPVTSKYLFISC